MAAEVSADWLLACLNVSERDKFVLVREHELADSNFVLSHLIKQVLSNSKNKICFVLMHNTIGHYHNVGKRLGFDLMAKIKAGAIEVIEPMGAIFQEMQQQNYQTYVNNFPNQVVRALMSAIKETVYKMHVDNGGRVYLILDELSHLFDVGVEFRRVVYFVSSLNRFLYQKKLNMYIGMHVGDENDERISNALEYNADVQIDVNSLGTGQSSEVTGVLTITTHGGARESIYHYKAHDREIKVFRPGQSLNFLYR